MFCSPTAWFVPLVFILDFGLVNSPALARNTYTFSADYDTLNTSKVISSNISEASITGESSNAPYGLNKISGLTYTQADLAAGIFSFTTDPENFGLQGIPIGSILFSGSGSNTLFGTDNATGTIDFNTLTAKASGTCTITGGEGIFRDATGTLDFSEVDTLSLNSGVPFTGRASVNGTIQIVPEPKPGIPLLSMGAIIGLGVLLRRCRFSTLT